MAYKAVVKVGAGQRWQHIGDVSRSRGDVDVAAVRRVVGGDDCAIEEGGGAVCTNATSTVGCLVGLDAAADERQFSNISNGTALLGKRSDFA